MRTEALLAVCAYVCARSGATEGAAGAGARDVRQVYEVGDGPPPPAWPPAPRLHYAQDLVYRLYDDASAAPAAVPPPPRLPLPAPRMRLRDGLLTFPTQEPDPRLRKAISVLVLRQLPVRAALQDARPPATQSPVPGGALSFAPVPTPRPWWRAPPPAPVAVSPRLAESASESLVLGVSPLVARLHGAVAMGSGGAGYARLPDGRLVIGSGSIGFARFDVITLPQAHPIAFI